MYVYLEKVGYFVVRFIRGGARCSSVVRAFARDAVGRLIDPSWGGPLFLVLRSEM